MGYSAILRRWVSRRVLKSDNYFPNRMMSSTGGVVSSCESAPWLMLSSCYVLGGESVLQFYSLAKNEFYSFFVDEYKKGGGSGWRWKHIDRVYNFNCVGSSHGWLAWYTPKDPYLLLLSEPTSDRLIKLPTLNPKDTVGRLILDQNHRLAFISFGSGLAFCSPGRTLRWTHFDANRVFDNFVYSNRHNRLFGITRNHEDKNTKLECWDVDVESPPRLEWMMDFDDDDVDDRKKLKYLVCAEHTGDLFLVVRHVCKNNTVWKPYTTLDFDVYKININWEGRNGKVVRMEDSLQGLAMFVGMNQSFAMRASEVSGVKPNSVYFAWDNRLTQPEDKNGGGIFDYQTRDFSEFCNANTYYFGNPVWFTPRPISV